MQCSCGGETVPSSHSVMSKSKIDEWLGRHHDNPIIINKDTCRGCGRQSVKINDAVNGILLERR